MLPSINVSRSHYKCVYIRSWSIHVLFIRTKCEKPSSWVLDFIFAAFVLSIALFDPVNDDSLELCNDCFFLLCLLWCLVLVVHVFEKIFNALWLLEVNLSGNHRHFSGYFLFFNNFGNFVLKSRVLRHVLKVSLAKFLRCSWCSFLSFLLCLHFGYFYF